MTTTRRDFLKTVGIGSISLSMTNVLASCHGPKNRPNILFIMADDHAAHALSCYGSTVNRTPNLDRLATEGVRFENCFCTNSLCAPSRAAILTGKYSHLNGVMNNRTPFDGSQVTFPGLLQQAGYQTALVGKWHLESDPTGFDYWHILPGQGEYRNPTMIEMGQNTKHEGYVTDIITDQALDWLRRRSNTEPFLLMLQHKAPHMPWEWNEKYTELYDGETIPEPETLFDDYRTRSAGMKENVISIARHLNNWMHWEIPDTLPGEARTQWLYQTFMRAYLRSVASLDDSIGRVLAFLDEAGLAENTIVVYTSDQGFFLGDHGLFDKRFMYEESLRMPLLVRYPQEVNPGFINRDIVLNVDFAETFLDFAGVTPPADMQGHSLRPLLLGNTPPDWRTSMYYHYSETWQVKPHYGIRTGRYKLLHYYYGMDEWELYDLTNDPHELNNIYFNPESTPIIENLRLELERLRRECQERDLAEYLPQSPVKVDHKAAGCQVVLKYPYSSRYTGGSKNALTDGVRAPDKQSAFPDYSLWQGFEENDLHAVVDLKKIIRLHKISSGYLQNQVDWIFLPTSVEYSVSRTGKSFQSVARLAHNIPLKRSDAFRHAFTHELDGIEARYVRVRATNVRSCPPWHPGAGGKAWLFVDEVIVE